MIPGGGEEILVEGGTVGAEGFALLALLGEGAVVSPVSIALALYLALLGTTLGSESERQLTEYLSRWAGGKTAEEAVATIFGALASTDPLVDLAVANSIWGRASVREQYKNMVKSKAAADAYPLPREAAPINQWVGEKTNGVITHLLDSIDPSTVAVLVNAVYFKGKWKLPFDSKLTEKGVFYTGGGEKSVMMMKMNNEKFEYSELSLSDGKCVENEMGMSFDTPVPKGDVQIVKLPYGKGSYSAHVALPIARDGLGLDELVKHLADSPQTWSQVMQNKSSRRSLNLTLPRFKATYGVESLTEALQALGVTTPFSTSPNKFNRMAEEDVSISDVLHKCVIEVDEEGTVAAAVTGITMRMTSIPEPPMPFYVDHPFLFIISENKSGSILFAGRIDDPM